jgi:hypothetical protein
MNPPRIAREEVYGAVFALAAEARWGDPLEGFKVMSRRVKLFSDVPSASQPALFQAEHAELTTKQTRQPSKDTWDLQWIIYHSVSDPNAVGAVTNNLILDAVEKVLAPKPTDPGFLDERNTLGGRVHHCFITGSTFKDPGDIDSQAMLIVPIKIIIP